MTQHNKELEELFSERFTKNMQCLLEIAEGKRALKEWNQHAGNLLHDMSDSMGQAEAKGAAKLAEELLGSEEMEEMKIYEDGAFLEHRNEGNMIANLAINAIKAKIKELCPTTTPSST